MTYQKGHEPHEAMGRIHNRQVMFLTEPEMFRLFKTFTQLRDEPSWAEKIFWARTLVCVGSRIEETTRIRLEDIGEKYLITRHGKGGKDGEKEWFPFYGPHLRYWMHIRRTQNEQYLFPKRGAQLCNTHRRGKVTRIGQSVAMSVRTGSYWWHEVLEEAGIRSLCPHAARHTFATWAAERLQQQDLQDQLGHEDYRTTDRYYRGSIPGRRFVKDKPAWEEVAEQEAAHVHEMLDRKLTVVK